MYDRNEAKNIAGLAVEHVCNLGRSFVLLHKSHQITMKEETALIRVLDELRFGIPLQYVIGEAHFYGLKFKVDSSVLIPRPETEELVNWVLESIREDAETRNSDSMHIIDIGTGSGCIPIALKKNLPQADMYALDISNSAIETAIRNAVENQTEVHFFQGDILNPSLTLLPLTFSVIVSNPPYVRSSEKQQMHTNVLDHEPHSALFVPDEDPLLFYRSIADFAKKHLNQEGSLFLEINESLGKETAALLEARGFLTELRKDLQGKDRMIKAWRD